MLSSSYRQFLHPCDNGEPILGPSIQVWPGAPQDTPTAIQIALAQADSEMVVQLTSTMNSITTNTNAISTMFQTIDSKLMVMAVLRQVAQVSHLLGLTSIKHA
jgi:hypothetical protein